MPADLPALAARLRDATGKHSDREILRALCAAFGMFVYGSPDEDEDDAPDIQLFVCQLGGEPDVNIDAAVALVRAVEPDVWWKLRQPFDHDRPGAHAFFEARHAPYAHGAYAPTPALALCLALVEWRIAHGGA